MKTQGGFLSWKGGFSPIEVAYPIDFTTTAGQRVCNVQVPAPVTGVTTPVKMTVGFMTTTVFTGTTPQFFVGKTATANELLNGAAPPTTINQGANQATSYLLTASTDIYVKFAGGGSNLAGAGLVVLTFTPLDVTKSTQP